MFNIRSAIVASSLGLAVCVIAPSSDATGYLTGYGAFRSIPNPTSQSCVIESSGGALNNCSSGTPLTFDLTTSLTTPNTIVWSIRATSFGSASAAITCRATAFNQLGDTAVLGAQQTFAPSGIDTKTFNVSMPPNHSLRLQCLNVPRNKGILALYWQPNTLS